MDITLDLPQTIGTQSGTQNNGVLVGHVAKNAYNGNAFFTHSHEINYAILNGLVIGSAPLVESWSQIQDELNTLVPTELFSPTPTYDYRNLYLAVREGITAFKFNVTTLGTGTFIVDAYYNSPTGYILLPGATFSTNFLKTTGISEISFTPPADWVEDFIGTPTSRERWLRLTIRDATFVTIVPVVEGAWEISSVPTNTSSSVPSFPFYNPYKDLLPTAGDSLYFSSSAIPYGMRFAYQNPIGGAGTVSYKYSLADGSFNTLSPISDTSAGFTSVNQISNQKTTLTASGVGASASTVEGVDGDCYVECEILATPTASSDRMSVGLSSTTTGTVDYELAATYDGANSVYQILINGTVEYTSDPGMPFPATLQVWRYNELVYFKVNGETLPLISLIPVTGILHPRFTSPDIGTVIKNCVFVNWTKNRATVEEFTLVDDVDFTSVLELAADNLYPAYYYIQFIPPTDFASLSALFSKTGVAGYNLGVETLGTPTSNAGLMIEDSVSTDSADNLFFPTGTQTTLNNLTLQFTEPEQLLNDQTFILLVKNTVGIYPQAVVLSPNSPLLSPITAVTEKIGMTGIIITQVDGDESLLIGGESYFYLST